jgi:hypothetical protein
MHWSLGERSYRDTLKLVGARRRALVKRETVLKWSRKNKIELYGLGHCSFTP